MNPTQQEIVDALMEALRTNNVLRRTIRLEGAPEQIKDEPATIAFSTTEGEDVFLKVEMA
jgi:hypothetical protein